MDIIIRQEQQADWLAVEELTREAFWNLYRPGCDEHYLVHTMREHPDFLPELAFVAELDGRIVGSILYMKSHVENELGERLETLSFGPLCVHPEFQRAGIGTRLIEHTKRLALERNCPAIIILGDPHNYCKHGFRTGKDLGVATRDGRYPLGLLVLELRPGAFAGHSWKFMESDAYNLDPVKVEEYDATLPPKVKAWQYSQELFSMLVRAFVE